MVCFGASGFSAARYASLAQRTTASRRAAALRSRGASTVTCNQDADFDFVVVFDFAASSFVVAAGGSSARLATRTDLVSRTNAGSVAISRLAGFAPRAPSILGDPT